MLISLNHKVIVRKQNAGKTISINDSYKFYYRKLHKVMNNDSIFAWYLILYLGSLPILKITPENIKSRSQELMNQLSH